MARRRHLSRKAAGKITGRKRKKTTTGHRTRKKTTAQIQAKPTIYGKVSFKSRLEARWAVFLDHHTCVADWVYEPRTWKDPKTNWMYTPDFLVKVGPIQVLLEVKPDMPSREYIENLGIFTPIMPHSLWVAFGDFYEGTPSLFSMAAKGLPPEPLTACGLFPFQEEAIQTAAAFRFDLPQTPPSFRRGVQGETMSHVKLWVKEERAKEKAKRTAQRKKKKGK